MSDEHKPSFEFGYPERQGYFFEIFEPFLFGLAEFQEAFDLVIGQIGKHADDLPKRLIFCLGRMAWEDLNEMLLLCQRLSRWRIKSSTRNVRTRTVFESLQSSSRRCREILGLPLHRSI